MHGAEDDSRQATALFEEAYGRLPRDGSAGALITLVERFARLPYENLSKILAWDGGRRPPELRLLLRKLQLRQFLITCVQVVAVGVAEVTLL